MLPDVGVEATAVSQQLAVLRRAGPVVAAAPVGPARPGLM
jgi:hypothetical protein